MTGRSNDGAANDVRASLPSYQDVPLIDATPFRYSGSARALIARRIRPPLTARGRKSVRPVDLGVLVSDLEHGVVVARNDAMRIRRDERGIGAVRKELAAIRRAAKDLERRLRTAGNATILALRANGGVGFLSSTSAVLSYRDLEAQVAALAGAAQSVKVYVVAVDPEHEVRRAGAKLSVEGLGSQLRRLGDAARACPLSHALVRPSRGAAANYGAMSFARQCLELIFPLHLGVEPQGLWARDLLDAAFRETKLRRGTDTKRLIEEARAAKRENDNWIRIGPAQQSRHRVERPSK